MLSICQAVFWLENNAWFIKCFSDFKVSSVLYAGDCVPTEVFIFSTANDVCKYCIDEILYLYLSLKLCRCAFCGHVRIKIKKNY